MINGEIINGIIKPHDDLLDNTSHIIELENYHLTNLINSGVIYGDYYLDCNFYLCLPPNLIINSNHINTVEMYPEVDELMGFLMGKKTNEDWIQENIKSDS